MQKFSIFILCFFVIAFSPTLSFSDTNSDINNLLDRECINLKKEKLSNLILTGFSSDLQKGLDPDLLKIMEGVIKRTDFDGISEEKTFEIIKLVYGAYKKGASLEYLDQIFDVAYSRDISVDQLFAAANSLKEFYNSDVPQDIYEEFVYHAIEEKWDPFVMPILTRGLIYGVDRGLTAQKVALAIIIDVDQNGLKKKSADELVLDAIKFVRGKEPEKWKPMKDVEKELMMKLVKKDELEKLRQDAETKKKQKEIEKQKAEVEIKKIRPEDAMVVKEHEKRVKEIEKMVKAYQDEIYRYQKEESEVDKAVKEQAKKMEREKEKRNREREEKRRKELAAMEQKAVEYSKRGNLDIDKLFTSIDKYIGIPYRFGGDSENGIDCSAFTRRVYREQGIEIPRVSYEQARIGRGVGGSSLQPGDLVFFNTSIMGTISHVGVYIDNNTFAHASSSQGVTKSSLRERYFSKRYVRANRIIGE